MPRIVRLTQAEFQAKQNWWDVAGLDKSYRRNPWDDPVLLDLVDDEPFSYAPRAPTLGVSSLMTRVVLPGVTDDAVLDAADEISESYLTCIVDNMAKGREEMLSGAAVHGVGISRTVIGPDGRPHDEIVGFNTFYKRPSWWRRMVWRVKDWWGHD